MEKTETMLLWRRFTLREAILLAFCATFILLTRTGLRLHLHLPGHVMFFMMFFLLLARGCVPKTGAATLVGLITGSATMLMGLSNGSPLILAKFLIPALMVDLCGVLYPSFPASYWVCIAVGIVAAATRSLSVSWLEVLAGVEEQVILREALLTALMNCGYGACGAALVPAVVRRLKANNLIGIE